MFSSFLNLGIARVDSGRAFYDCVLVTRFDDEFETNSLKGIGKVCKGSKHVPSFQFSVLSKNARKVRPGMALNQFGFY